MADILWLPGMQTFQKLIFVSNLVFGDQKAAFLLPWRRTFNLTDSQLAVARRDSAKALFKSFLDERGGFQVGKGKNVQPMTPAASMTRCPPPCYQAIQGAACRRVDGV